MKQNKKAQNATEIPRDYSNKENKVGCGYCDKEKKCIKRDPSINKAKEGCEEWKHWQDSPDKQ